MSSPALEPDSPSGGKHNNSNSNSNNISPVSSPTPGTGTGTGVTRAQQQQQQQQRLQVLENQPSSPFAASDDEYAYTDIVLSDEGSYVDFVDMDDLDESERSDLEELAVLDHLLFTQQQNQQNQQQHQLQLDGMSQILRSIELVTTMEEEGDDCEDDDDDDDGDADDEGDDGDADDDEGDDQDIDIDISAPNISGIPPPPLTTDLPYASLSQTASSDAVSPITSPVSSRSRSKQFSAMLVDDKPWRMRLSVPGSSSNNNTSNNNSNTSNNNSNSNSASRQFLRYIRKPWNTRSSSDRQQPSTEDGDGSLPPVSSSAANADEQQQPPLSPTDTRSTSNARRSARQQQELLLADDVLGDSSASDEVSSGESSVDSWDAENDADKMDSNTNAKNKWEEPVDFNSLAVLPNRFLTTATASTATTTTDTALNTTIPTAPPYLDPTMMIYHGSLSRKTANRFVHEHGILLQAAMELLTERDQIGVEGKMDSADNIWKKGPLKKLSYQVGRRQRPASTKWKVKYVELRRGNLCYYEDSGQGRKTIHLRQADTVVQESSDNAGKQGPGFAFELSVQGSPARFWMASSEEERQAWVRAIQVSMIGGEEDGPRRELDLMPHQEALTLYKQLQKSVQQADTQEDYLGAIQSTVQVEQEQTSLQIPVQWVRDQVQVQETTSAQPIAAADRLKTSNHAPIAPRKLLKTSIADFWINMGQTTFSINGLTVPRTSPLSSERIMGALTRCILEFDKSFVADDEQDADGCYNERAPGGSMSELQAVSYARNILLSVLRGKEQQDAACAVNHLLENPDLVVVSGLADQEDAVVHMEVSFAGEDIQEDDLPQAADEQTGWLRTRRKQSGWRKRFACLSGAVLSYYDAATPRPHGLRGQLVLGGATVQPEDTPEGGGEDTRYILRITTHDQERLLAFDDESEYYDWKNAIQIAIDSLQCVTQAVPAEALEQQQQQQQQQAKQQRNSLLKGAERVIKGAIPDGSIRGSIRVIKGATGGGIKVIKGARHGSIKVIKGAVGRLRLKSNDSSSVGAVSVPPVSRMQRHPSMQLLLSNTTVLAGKREPTVQCVVQATSTFGIAARDDNAADDTTPEILISVRAKLFQAFLLSGGPSGRMARGDALVELEFLGEPVDDDDGDDDEDREEQDSNFF
jgi:hypothetical protein